MDECVRIGNAEIRFNQNILLIGQSTGPSPRPITTAHKIGIYQVEKWGRFSKSMFNVEATVRRANIHSTTNLLYSRNKYCNVALQRSGVNLKHIINALYL